MKQSQFDTLMGCREDKGSSRLPVALIVDSPWIPGYCGISTMDYFVQPDLWWDANMRIRRDFPEAIFVPDFWVEFGMAAEPSGFGCKVSFFEHTTPNVHHLVKSADDVELLAFLPDPNPRNDGLMPFALNLYKRASARAVETEEKIKIVAARGPLTIASHMMGLTEFLIAVKIYPGEVHKLLKKTAALSKNWLSAQAEVLPDAQGILLLDDVVGLLSGEDYLEFAHPYLQEIFSAFPSELKIYHNDTDNPACYEYLGGLGIDIFNFTHMQDIATVRKLAGDRVCLMGNVPPLGTLAKGSPEEVYDAAKKCIKSHGTGRGMILSAGGGVSPGTPNENIKALICASESP